MDFADKVLAELVARIRRLDAEIEARIAEQRSRFRYAVTRGRVLFDREAVVEHRRYRRGLWRQFRHSPLPVLLVSPVIYSLIVPLALLDAVLALYQAVCFRVYGIVRVRRGDYVAIDHHRLAYLNPLEKLNCVYCGYANGVIAYAREIGARTEEYWCPIKHSRPVPTPHSRYLHFVDYGDAEGYRRRQEELRAHAGAPGETPQA